MNVCLRGRGRPQYFINLCFLTMRLHTTVRETYTVVCMLK